MCWCCYTLAFGNTLFYRAFRIGTWWGGYFIPLSSKIAFIAQHFKNRLPNCGDFKKIEPDCREGVRAQLERMKELCKERNNLYEKQNDLKGQKQKIEKPLER